ncbi:ribosome recycling factor [Anaplasmataceae bacterium AB001_6]|nr:ribosome recycling factor [Anaplasmataceae bacterium AB001_6]
MSDDDLNILLKLDNFLKDAASRMISTVNFFVDKCANLRTDRASVGMFDDVVIDAYGDRLPLRQLANVNLIDNSRLLISVWDSSIVHKIFRSLQNAELGVGLDIADSTIKITLPMVTQERRKEMVKIAESYAEESKISIRNIRRDSNSRIKKIAEDGVSSDERDRYLDKIQSMTDDNVKKIDDLLKKKCREIIN